MSRHAIAMMMIGCFVAASAAGCQRAPGPIMDAAAMRGETYTVNPPQAVFDATSMHFGGGAADTARQQTAKGKPGAGAGRGRGETPWWVDRNDGRLNVRRGGNRSSVTDYVVHTEDRQRSFDGRIHNHYQRTRRSVEYGTLVR